MQLINIGFGNMVSSARVIAIVSPESAPIKRIIQEAKDKGTLIDATYGRRTRAVLIMDSDHVVLSAIQPETVAGRAGDDTPCLFFFCQLGHHVIGTANLERTGDLQVLCLEKQIAVRTEFRCLNQIRFPDHAPEHVACLIDFIQCQHG